MTTTLTLHFISCCQPRQRRRRYLCYDRRVRHFRSHSTDEHCSWIHSPVLTKLLSTLQQGFWKQARLEAGRPLAHLWPPCGEGGGQAHPLLTRVLTRHKGARAVAVLQAFPPVSATSFTSDLFPKAFSALPYGTTRHRCFPLFCSSPLGLLPSMALNPL